VANKRVPVTWIVAWPLSVLAKSGSDAAIIKGFSLWLNRHVGIAAFVRLAAADLRRWLIIDAGR